MIPRKIKDDIYFVGSLNPNMRTFDIIMKTEYGTSYNAYLVKGEKTALVETVHAKFFEDFEEGVSSLADLGNIDYLIMNHTEPDHSGSVERLLDLNPDIQIVATMAGIKNLKAITNKEFHSIVAKDGETLDLGNGLVMKFIIAPNLHWPDSMFTYLESRKVIFTCDFLGSHYCEPAILDHKIAYPEKYKSAFKNYYEAIFGPFKPFVLAGLNKMEGLDFDTVLTSHGPILSELIKENMAAYREWSTPVKNEKPKVVIAYVSAYGYTRSMAEALRDGLIAEGISVTCHDVIKSDLAVIQAEIGQADGVLFGSPTINRDAVKPIWDVLSMIDPVANKGKPAGIFGSYGWSGEACPMLAQRIDGLKLKRIGEPIKAVFKPSEDIFTQLKEYAKEFAAACK